MKNLYLMGLSTLISFSVFAQSDSARSTTKTTTPEFKRSVAVKFNPGSLAFGKLSLAGEWNYKKKRSVTFYVGLPMKKEVPESILKEMIGDGTKSPKVEYKSTSVMAGYRMYMGKRPMTGFYFEPYVKYMSFEMAGTYSDEIDFGAPYGKQPANLLLTSKYSGFGLGAQLGLQFMIAKRVVFDMFLLGPEANMGKVTAAFNDVTGPATNTYWQNGDIESIEKDIKDAVKDIPMIGEKINVKADRAAKSITADYNGFLPGLRAGISVGIRF